MSTDCENLLKRFLVLNPVKRGTLEVPTPVGRKSICRTLLGLHDIQKACLGLLKQEVKPKTTFLGYLLS
jgi:hypothetical protein